MSETGQITTTQHVLTSSRQAQDDTRQPPKTPSPFYPACTQRIPQRSQLRRELISAAPVTCRRVSNDFKPFDLREELLLRVVRLGRLRALQPRVLRRLDRADSAGDHLRDDLRSDGHSSNGAPGSPVQGRGVSRVSAAGEQVRSVAAEVPRQRRVADLREGRSTPTCRRPVFCSVS